MSRLAKIGGFAPCSLREPSVRRIDKNGFASLRSEFHPRGAKTRGLGVAELTNGPRFYLSILCPTFQHFHSFYEP